MGLPICLFPRKAPLIILSNKPVSSFTMSFGRDVVKVKKINKYKWMMKGNNKYETQYFHLHGVLGF